MLQVTRESRSSKMKSLVAEMGAGLSSAPIKEFPRDGSEDASYIQTV